MAMLKPEDWLSFREPRDGAIAARVSEFASAGVAGRIAAQDPQVWGPDVGDAADRLGWVTLAQRAQPVLDAAGELREELHGRGIDRVVLCGMGGSSLAPEVICAAAGVPLTVVDSTAPSQVLGALQDSPERTVYVVASKSGGTVETDSHRRLIEAVLAKAGLVAGDHIVVITDPDSPLHRLAAAAGYRTFLADPQVGGRFSALSAFGLVPSVLAGANCAELVAQARAAAPSLAEDGAQNPALWLAAVLDLAQADGAEKLVVLDDAATLPGFGAWLEQLVAESTGKHGTGVLPIAWDGQTSAEVRVLGEALPARCALYDVAPAGALDSAAGASAKYAVAGQTALGAMFLAWEYATAILGYALGIDPFDQPDVESAKASARAMLSGGAQPADPRPVGTQAGGSGDRTFTNGQIRVTCDGGSAASASSLDAALGAFLHDVSATGYVAVQAFVDRTVAAESCRRLRCAVESVAGVPVSLGFGPRYLHSTGQYHKGGHPNGWFLQVTADSPVDMQVPGQDFSLQQLITAQAAGDAAVLARRGRPVLRLHLADLEAGLARLVTVLDRLV